MAKRVRVRNSRGWIGFWQRNGKKDDIFFMPPGRDEQGYLAKGFTQAWVDELNADEAAKATEPVQGEMVMGPIVKRGPGRPKKVDNIAE